MLRENRALRRKQMGIMSISPSTLVQTKAPQLGPVKRILLYVQVTLEPDTEDEVPETVWPNEPLKENLGFCQSNTIRYEAWVGLRATTPRC